MKAAWCGGNRRELRLLERLHRRLLVRRNDCLADRLALAAESARATSVIDLMVNGWGFELLILGFVAGFAYALFWRWLLKMETDRLAPDSEPQPARTSTHIRAGRP